MKTTVLASPKAFFNLKTGLFILFVFFNEVLPAHGQRPPTPIVLTAEDTATFAAPPEGFDALRKNIAHGQLDYVFYESKTVGNKRRMLIYTPPGYSAKYRLRQQGWADQH